MGNNKLKIKNKNNKQEVAYAGQNTVGPTSAANVGRKDVPTLGQRRNAIWVIIKSEAP